MIRRKSVAAGVAAALVAACGLLSSGAWAQANYPDRPIKIIVPFTPGGGNDVLARSVQPAMQARLGQPVIVENKPGAGGHIGGDFVAKSPPDGYTLLISQNGLAMAPWLEKNMPYDPLALAPIGILLVAPVIAAVNNDLPVKSINELIAYAKANPGKLSYATPGVGTPHHLFTELFLSSTGTKMVMVPYKGVAGMLTDLIAGRVNVLFSSYTSMLPHMQAGKIRGVGVAELKRLATIPDVPAIAESLPGFNVNFWFGFSAPAGTPEAITRKLSDELRAIVNLPDVSERLKKAGYEIAPSTPEEMRASLRSDYEKWGKVVKGAGIKVE
jgi:tripartite-type tricarboxylate transporter receptor subunit TctC